MPKLARLRRPLAAFLLNWAIIRPATCSITFGQPFPSYMQSFIKIRGAVLEKNANKTMTLYNLNKDAGRVFNTWINQMLYPFPSIAWRADIFQILIKSALRNSHREVVAARSRIRPRQYYITSVRLFRRPLRRRRTDGKRGKPSKNFVSSLLSYLLTLPTWNS